MSTRIIDETILRVYIPKKQEETATKPSYSLTVSTIITSNFQDKDKDIKNKQGLPKLLYTPTALYMR